MYKIIISNFVCFFFISITLTINIHADSRKAEEDSQLWTGINTTVRLTDRFDLINNGDLRYGDDISRQVRESAQTGFNYRITKWLTITPSYRYVSEENAPDVHKRENRAGLWLTARFPYKRWEFFVANGFEYRFAYDEPNSWRLRPRVTLEYPIGADYWGLKGYISDEVAWDSKYDGPSWNRAYIGLKKKLNKNFTIEPYFCEQISDGSRSNDLHIIGLTLRINLDFSSFCKITSEIPAKN